MAWDGIVSGTLSFPKGTLAAWKKSVVEPLPPDWPSWIRARGLDGQSVGESLRALETWNEVWRHELHGGEIAQVQLSAAEARFRGYFTGWWFAFGAGRIAALVVGASRFGARGQVAFVDVTTTRGHVVVLDGRSGVSVRELSGPPPDDILDTHEWLISKGLSIPAPGEAGPRHRAMLDREMPDGLALGPSFPFRAAHQAAGMVPDDDSLLLAPSARGTALELEHTRAAVGLYDLSQHATVSMLARPALDLLAKTHGFEALDEGGVRPLELRTPSGELIDHVLVVRRGNLVVLGSPGEAPTLQSWLEMAAKSHGLELHAHAAPLGGPVLTDTQGGNVAWLGPRATQHASEILGVDLSALPMGSAAPITTVEGTVVRTRWLGLDAVIVLHALVTRLRPRVQDDVSSLCGSDAELALAIDAGLSRPAAVDGRRPMLTVTSD
ncbi:MAG: hypothetical protein K1X94_25515 [Sandaracinaceae bacterium]|nr:hypothetical protein [Sandaracinaceae bacterium]